MLLHKQECLDHSLIEGIFSSHTKGYVIHLEPYVFVYV